jgi:hypothetical protein
MKLFNKACMSLVGASLLFGQVAFAGDEKQKEEEKKQEQSASQSQDMKQVEGTVIQHKFVNVFKDKKQMEEAQKSGSADSASKKMLVVMLKTAKGNDRLLVDLGEMQEAPKIKDGETKLQVEGKLIDVGTQKLFVAKRAKLDGSKIDIQRKSS